MSDMPSGVVVARVCRDATGTYASLRLPRIFANAKHWMDAYGDDWDTQHFLAADAYISKRYGFEWIIDYLEWFETLEDYKKEFNLQEIGND